MSPIGIVCIVLVFVLVFGGGGYYGYRGGYLGTGYGGVSGIGLLGLFFLMLLLFYVTR